TEVFAERTILKVDGDLLHRLRGAVPSPRPQPAKLEWPTPDEAARVPRWAMLAFLTRVVRRLRPFFVRDRILHRPDAIEMVDGCLAAAECFAAAPEVPVVVDRFLHWDEQLRTFRDLSENWVSSPHTSPARMITGMLSVSHMWVISRERWEPPHSVSIYADF